MRDGNCFFAAVSHFLSANHDVPQGTYKQHTVLRNQVTSFIRTNAKWINENSSNYVFRGNTFNDEMIIALKKSNVADPKFARNKILMETTAEILKRPIIIVNYPVMEGSKPRFDLQPTLEISNLGSRKNEPVFVHFDGVSFHGLVPGSFEVKLPKLLNAPKCKNHQSIETKKPRAASAVSLPKVTQTKDIKKVFKM